MQENNRYQNTTPGDQDKNLGQQSNQNWDDQNDQRTSGTSEPNPERLSSEESNTGREGSEGNNQPTGGDTGDAAGSGSAFNESQGGTAGYGSSQRSDRENVGPLDADLAELPSQKRSSGSGNLTGSGLG